MTLYAAINPYPVILSQIGGGLNGGKVYIGMPGQDPEVYPVTVYWDFEGTDPAFQPLATAGGYIVRAGAPAEVFAPAEYSVRVRDRFNVVVFYNANVRSPLAEFIESLATDEGAGLIGFDPEADYPDDTLGKYLATFDNIDRPFSYVGDFQLKSLGSEVPDSGIYIGQGGNSLSFATPLSTPTGGADTDNQRAVALVRSITTDDNNSEEQSLCLITTIGTGYYTEWATSTAYSVGANVRVNDNMYRCTTAGTSAGSGTGPTGKSASITDGTVVWRWINDGAIAAKVSIYNEVEVLAGAGDSWGQANNVEIESGNLSKFIATTELDLTNNSGTDSTFGGLNRYNLYVFSKGESKSTSSIEVSTTNTTSDAALWGLHFSGSRLASNSVIGIDASGAIGIGIGFGAGGTTAVTFTDSAFKDSSTAPRGVRLAGTYSSSGLEVSGTAPVALNASGIFSLAGIRDGSTSPCGIQLSGTYSVSPMIFSTLPANYADDAAAAIGGLPVGALYRTGSILKVRVA